MATSGIRSEFEFLAPIVGFLRLFSRADERCAGTLRPDILWQGAYKALPWQKFRNTEFIQLEDLKKYKCTEISILKIFFSFLDLRRKMQIWDFWFLNIAILPRKVGSKCLVFDDKAAAVLAWCEESLLYSHSAHAGSPPFLSSLWRTRSPPVFSKEKPSRQQYWPAHRLGQGGIPGYNHYCKQLLQTTSPNGNIVPPCPLGNVRF